MTGVLQDYLTRFASSARAAGVPGRRIGEAVAEIESHVDSGGESPHEVFGDPVQYAQELARSHADQRPGCPYWRLLAQFYGILVGGAAVTGGVLQLAGRPIQHFGVGVASTFAVSLAFALVWIPAYRRAPSGVGMLWVMPAMIGAFLGTRLGDQLPDPGWQLPAAVTVAIGAVLLIGGVVFSIQAMPRPDPIVDPYGRDRSDLGGRVANGRLVLAAIFAFVLLTTAISLWIDV